MADNSDYSIDSIKKLIEQKDWEQVVDKCNEAILAIGEEKADPKYLFYRAKGSYEAEDQTESLTDIKTILANPNISVSLRFDSLVLKANCLFSMEEYESCKMTAKAAFAERSDSNLYQLINKCNSQLGLPEETPPAGPRKKTYRHEWYQTNSEVVVSILIKKVTHDDLTYQFKETHLFMEVKLPDDQSFILNIELFDKILFYESKVTILTSKIEIRLKKANPVSWGKLEKPATPPGSSRKIQTFTPNESSTLTQDPQKFPSSSKTFTDWDKLAAEVTKEEAEEKPEGDAALNKFFQQIYGKGSEEQQRAMMKSFQESGGTVLSTNWDEVGKEKVEVKPPDGMEYKKYEQ